MAKSPAQRVGTESRSDNETDKGSSTQADSSDDGTPSIHQQQTLLAQTFGLDQAGRGDNNGNFAESFLEVARFAEALRSDYTPESNSEFLHLQRQISRLAKQFDKTRNLISKSLEYDAGQLYETNGTDVEQHSLDRGEVDETVNIVQWHLDAIAEKLANDPSLAADICAHEIFSDAASKAGVSVEVDPLALEIVKHVEVLWDQRKRPEHGGEHWGRNVIAYVSHWYEPFLSDKRFSQKYLNLQPNLYNAYTSYIARYPAKDLKIPKDSRVFISDPKKAMIRKRKMAAQSMQALRKR